jgi:DNA-nicking Smr family endonuclease
MTEGRDDGIPDDIENLEPVAIPIEGVLDLHTVKPAEVKDIVPDYLAECRKRGILEVRLIHGKGMGVLRRTVQAVLERIPEVAGFRTADEGRGGWGATIVFLKPPAPPCGEVPNP